jgi:hypothetical protein
MSLTDLASLGSFVSAVAVLISLIYLSLQVKQAERNQQASIRATRVTRIVDIYMRLAEPSLSDAMSNASAGANVSDTEVRQFVFYCGARFYQAEDSFNQFQEGLLDQRAFDSLVAGLKNSLSEPGMRAYYKRHRDSFANGNFIEFMDKLVAETRLVPALDVAAQWRADVAAEMAAS